MTGYSERTKLLGVASAFGAVGLLIDRSSFWFLALAVWVAFGLAVVRDGRRAGR
jgi:hypothetical protein